MLGYYIRLALKSIARTKLTSVIVISALAVGIGVAMAFVTVLHVLSRDPLPEKSDEVFYVQLDSWSADSPYPGRGSDPLPTQVTYQDAVALSRSPIPSASSIHYTTSVVVRPDGQESRPFLASARAARAGFFSIFDAPFAAGGAWRGTSDESRERVVVLSRRLSERLYGTVEGVGRTVSLADQPFTVVGVLEDWEPSMRHYDLTTHAWAETEELFLPFDTAIDMELATNGNSDGWKPDEDAEGLSRFQAALRSERCWIQFYVQLDSPKKRAEFASFVDAYVLEQKSNGRFQRPVLTRLSTIPEVIVRWEVVPDVARVLRVISLLFLSLCVLSVVGLLLGSFLNRAQEVGIRRALGASRGAVFYQHMAEAGLLGLFGGFLGMFVSFGILSWITSVLPPKSVIDLTMTGPLFLVAFIMAVGSGLAAGIYPAYRVCAAPPAKHLKA